MQTFKGSRTVIIDLRIKKRKCEENMCKLVNSLDDDDEKRLCWFETNQTKLIVFLSGMFPPVAPPGVPPVSTMQPAKSTSSDPLGKSQYNNDSRE